MQESVRDCSQVDEFSKAPFLEVRLLRAPAAAYLATRVLPSSTTSGGAVPANAVSSLVVMSLHCWSWTSTVTLGCLALKSALTPSTMAWGALPVISQTVSLLGWFDVVVLLPGPPEQATATRPRASTTAVRASCRGFTYDSSSL